MDHTKYIEAFGILAAITVVIFFIKLRIVAREKYLKVLCFTTWKDVETIKKELEEKEGVWITQHNVQEAMSELVEEDLVEVMVLPHHVCFEKPVFNYRRKSDNDFSFRDRCPRTGPYKRFELTPA